MESNQKQMPMEPEATEMLTDEDLEDISGGPVLYRSARLIQNNNGGKAQPQNNGGWNNGGTGGPGH